MKEMVNIVIPAWNDFEFLTECLESIPDACQDNSFFITIVDNGSDKARADKFYGYLKDDDYIHVHRNKENMGFPIACNIGAKRKACPLIFFLNADVVLHEHAIDNLIMTMDDPEVGIVGMKLLFSENSLHGPAGRIQHAGLAMGIRARPYHLFIGWTEDNPKVMAMDDAWAVTGAGLMVRRSLWNKAGGFDEQYSPGTFEDLDLCLTIRELGYTIKVNMRAVGTHYVGHCQAEFPLNRNHGLFMNKWGEKVKWNEWKYL